MKITSQAKTGIRESAMGSGGFETDDSFTKTVFTLILHCPVSVASERPTALESRRIGILFGCKRLTHGLKKESFRENRNKLAFFMGTFCSNGH